MIQNSVTVYHCLLFIWVQILDKLGGIRWNIQRENGK